MRSSCCDSSVFYGFTVFLLVFFADSAFCQVSDENPTDSIPSVQNPPYLTEASFVSNLENSIFWIRGDQVDSPSQEENQHNAGYFNFNPAIPLDTTNSLYPGILDDYISLFAVFKTGTAEEHPMFELQTRNNSIFITNWGIITNETIPYEKARPEQGMLLYYMTGLDGVMGSNALSLEGLMELSQGAREKHQLMEFMVIPKLIHSRERALIESYLSIKYGISLLGERSYINSRKDTIWDYEKNKGFNHAITGIGRDDGIGLYQKQSGNSNHEGLYLGLEKIDSTNASNSATIENGTFLLWGHNNKSTTFNDDDDGLQKMERIWKIQQKSLTAVDTLTTQLLLQKEAFFENSSALETSKRPDTSQPETDVNTDQVWLVTQSTYDGTFDFDTATYSKQSVEEADTIIFDGVDWTASTSYFTFISAPDFFADFQIGHPLCSGDEKSPVTVRARGGKAPYHIEVAHHQNPTSYYSDTDTYTLYLKEGVYTITVSDASSGSYETELTVVHEPNVMVTLEEIWLLEEGQNSVTVSPTVSCEDCSPEKLTYEWYSDDKRIAQGAPQLAVEQAGTYHLDVTTAEGCTTRLPFTVKTNEHLFEGVTLHPNPITSNESFTLQFDLNAETDVRIKVFTPSGQLVNEASLPNIKEGVYTDSLTTSGSYFVVVEADQTTRTFKLIVK